MKFFLTLKNLVSTLKKRIYCAIQKIRFLYYKKDIILLINFKSFS